MLSESQSFPRGKSSHSVHIQRSRGEDLLASPPASETEREREKPNQMAGTTAATLSYICYCFHPRCEVSFGPNLAFWQLQNEVGESKEGQSRGTCERAKGWSRKESGGTCERAKGWSRKDVRGVPDVIGHPFVLDSWPPE